MEHYGTPEITIQLYLNIPREGSMIALLDSYVSLVAALGLVAGGELGREILCIGGSAADAEERQLSNVFASIVRVAAATAKCSTNSSDPRSRCYHAELATPTGRADPLGSAARAAGLANSAS